MTPLLKTSLRLLGLAATAGIAAACDEETPVNLPRDPNEPSDLRLACLYHANQGTLPDDLPETRYINVAFHCLTDGSSTGFCSRSYQEKQMGELDAAFAPLRWQFQLVHRDNIVDPKLYAEDLPEEVGALYQLFDDFIVPGAINVFQVPDYGGEKYAGVYKSLVAFGSQSAMIFLDSLIPLRGLVHEAGHFFGLLHPYDEWIGVERVARGKGANCESTGDLLCDTPAEPQPGECEANADCQILSCPEDETGEVYRPDIQNFMGAPDACLQDHFSPMQIAAMRCVADAYYSDLMRAEPTPSLPEISYLTVGCGNEDEPTTVQAAVDQISRGGLIEVCGREMPYQEPFYGSGASFTLLGRDGPAGEKATFDGAEKFPLFSFYNEADVTLENLVIQNGADPYYGGGGGDLAYSSRAALEQVVIRNCSAGRGGALSVFFSSELIMNGSQLYGNNSVDGDAIHLWASNARIRGGTISDHDGWHGAVMLAPHDSYGESEASFDGVDFDKFGPNSPGDVWIEGAKVRSYLLKSGGNHTCSTATGRCETLKR